MSASGFGGPCAGASPRAPASEKLTTSAPPPLSTSRREVVNRHGSPPSRTGRAHDRLDDAGMRPAAAQVVGERVLHSASLGFLVLARNAANSMIMPLMQ